MRSIEKQLNDMKRVERNLQRMSDEFTRKYSLPKVRILVREHGNHYHGLIRYYGAMRYLVTLRPKPLDLMEATLLHELGHHKRHFERGFRGQWGQAAAMFRREEELETPEERLREEKRAWAVLPKKHKKRRTKWYKRFTLESYIVGLGFRGEREVKFLKGKIKFE